MKSYALVILGSLMIGADICAASAMSQLNEHGQKVAEVRNLYATDQLDRAFKRAFACVDTLPAKEKAEVRFLLGELSLLNTKNGMRRNTRWATYWFSSAARSRKATPELRAAAKSRLHRLEKQQSSVNKSLEHLHAKDKITVDSAAQIEAVASDVTCLVCNQVCKNKHGLRVHKGHKKH